jgi:hypothetical protein
MSIGESIVARESTSAKWSRAWIWILALLLLGGGAAALYLFVLRDRGDGAGAVVSNPEPTPAPAVVRKKGTVKFEIDPSDVDITVAGQVHKGSPWELELEPGTYQVEMRHEGYKSKLRSIEVPPAETQTLMVTLEKIPRKVGREAAQQASLILASTPSGLEVVLDGKLLADRTPINRPIDAGPHTIALRQNGVEIWRQSLVAEVDADHEFRPVFKRAVGGIRTKSDKPGDPEPQLAPKIEPTTEPTPPAPVVPTPSSPDPMPPPPAPPNAPLKPRIVGPAETNGPITVAPTAVKRLSGGTPTLGASRPDQLPPVVAAKVCIDPAGSVTAVEIMTKLERHTIADLTTAIRTWRYAPYHQNKVAIAVCFSVNFRVK